MDEQHLAPHYRQEVSTKYQIVVTAAREAAGGAITTAIRGDDFLAAVSPLTEILNTTEGPQSRSPPGQPNHVRSRRPVLQQVRLRAAFDLEQTRALW